MDARQLLRSLAEHGPDAMADLDRELAANESRRAELLAWRKALADAMAPATRMTQKPGTMETP